MTSMEKRIVLAEWNWIGHHPIFFAYYVMALEDLGASVLALCPYPDEAREIVSNLRRTRSAEPSPGGSTTYRELKKVSRRFEGGFFSRLSGIDWTARQLRAIRAAVKTWQTGRIDLVFFACVYDWEFKWFRFADPFWSFPWSGLYMHLRSLRMPDRPDPSGRTSRPQKIFRGALCKSVAVFDEGMAQRFSSLIGKPVVVIPDFADGQLPEGKAELADSLKEFARGRPIVGLFGFLMKSKGVLPLVEISLNSRMAHVCFALGGEIVWSSFLPEEEARLREVLLSASNIWSYPNRISDEKQMNALMATCDVMYAAYHVFPSSSNIMAKAAWLKKPLIVSDGYLMAERVKRFLLGEIVPEDDMEARVQAIGEMTGDLQAWVDRKRPRWGEYLREHSYERLRDAFRELLSKL